MSTYFVADTHFGHANIIRYDRRPWETIEEMDEALIANWRRTVRDEDTVYHLGDVAAWTRPLTYDRDAGELGDVAPSWRGALDYLKQLTGQIRILPGNHDDLLVANAARIAEETGGRVQIVAPLLEVKGVASATLWLCHYALESWHHRDKTIHLHGHTHPGHDPFDASPGLRQRDRRYNICMGGLFHGARARAWRPLTLAQIQAIYAAREVQP